MSRVLGIDLGSAGGLALLTDAGDLLDVADMPVMADGSKGRPAVSSALLAAIIKEWAPDRAFVEFVAARPTDSKVGAFSFGRSRGAVEGVLGCCGIPMEFITAPGWKRAVNIPPGRDMKDLARSEAIRPWPAKAALFARRRDDGRAESALIAVAGLMRDASRKTAA